MTTPFDKAIEQVRIEGYHNHRKESHSDIVSKGLLEDLLQLCRPLNNDIADQVIQVWYNYHSPGDRERKVDLFIGEPTEAGEPDIQRVRLVLENKSVITAHRNKTNRFDDLMKTLQAIHGARSEAIIVATVLVGLAERVLNVPDRVAPMFRGREEVFSRDVLPRLSTGDQSLWTDFPGAVSYNRPTDPSATIKQFRQLPTRNPAQTHVAGYDYLMLVPIYINNVDSPHIPRPNPVGIDIDAEYERMIAQICRAYTARWHPAEIGGSS